MGVRMTRETILLSAGKANSVAGAATYLGVLSYPESEQKRQEFIRAVLAYVEINSCTSKDQLWRPQTVIPGLLLMNPKKVERTINLAIHRLEKHRIVAAEMAVLIDSNDSAFLQVRIDGKEPTVNLVAARAAMMLSATPQQETAPEHVINRAWSATKPVIHLAVALRGIILERYWERSVDFDNLIEQPNWVDRAVRQAEILRQHFVTDKPLRYRTASDYDLIQVQIK